MLGALPRSRRDTPHNKSDHLLYLQSTYIDDNRRIVLLLCGTPRATCIPTSLPCVHFSPGQGSSFPLE